VYAYLLSPSSSLSPKFALNATADPESYYLSESSYITYRNRILNLEGQVLNALGFNTHVALPHPLAITYLQTLDVFSQDHQKEAGKQAAARAIEYLNSALLSPQLLYLTHQPYSLATAAIYLAARETGVKLPECEWWEVFDCEREELGFLCVGMKSVEGWARKVEEMWGGAAMINRKDAKLYLEKNWNGTVSEDEEAEMARKLDDKVDAVS